MRRKPLVAILLGAATALVLASAGSAEDNAGFTPTDPASPGAERVLDAYWLLVGLGLFIFLVVTIPLLVFIVRYRSAGRSRDQDGPQIRGNTNLELGWTFGAVLLVVGLIAFVFYKLPGIEDPGRAAGEEPFEVAVEGRQFYWRYVYPNGVVAFDTLRLPIDREVTFAVSAPEGDVIHSFWVPALAGKRDAIPGDETTFDVLPERLGTYKVICGEFCGLQHAVMRGAVQVLPQAEFDDWLDEQEQAQASGESDLGGQIWGAVCMKCHGPEVVGEVGPPLEGNALVRDADAVEEIVRNGQGAMPAVGQGWTDREVDALTEFLSQTIAPGDDGEQS